MWYPTTPSSCVFSFVWKTHWATNGLTSRFHLKALAPSYAFQHAPWWDIWSPSCPNSIMFRPKDKCLAYSSTNLPKLLTSFPRLFHSTLNMTWTAPSLTCRYPLMRVHTSHWPYGYPPFTLCSSQRMQMNPWCNSWHFCYHCAGCWFPCGARIITCVSFQTHLTPFVDKPTLCSPKMAFAL